jgi:uncharacterized protein (TIGR02147 family)
MKQSQTQLLKLLHEELTRIRARSPQYSIRLFSKKLGLPVSALSGILNGKLPITRKSGEKILQNLAVDPKTAAQILQGLKYREDHRLRLSVLKTGTYSQLEMDQFYLISEWYYLAVWTLAMTDGFQEDLEWISKTLGIKKREAKSALSVLERLELLARGASGKLAPTKKSVKTTNGIPNTYIRKHHLEGLDLARRAMDEDEFSACDFSGITMTVDPEKLPEAKKLITDFRRSLSHYLEGDSKKEVYRMSIQLFPLSNRQIFSKNKKAEEAPNV